MQQMPMELWKPETLQEKVKAITDAIAAQPALALPLIAEMGEQLAGFQAKATADSETIKKQGEDLAVSQNAAFQLLQNKFQMGAPLPEGSKNKNEEKPLTVDALLRPDGLGLAI
jgi:hypothetical protein